MEVPREDLLTTNAAVLVIERHDHTITVSMLISFHHARVRPRICSELPGTAVHCNGSARHLVAYVSPSTRLIEGVVTYTSVRYLIL
jgi:hypothetical protein